MLGGSTAEILVTPSELQNLDYGSIGLLFKNRT